MSTGTTANSFDSKGLSEHHHHEEISQIELRGVHTHNLKGIDCNFPQGKLTVVTGLSGSGKSSLAFDTLYAEGQRRYTESLSTYARQFLQQLERPPVDFVKNIQPAIALKQHNEVNNARSTVGTVTEIDDHLQLLFTHQGITYCKSCQHVVKRDSVASALKALFHDYDEGARLILVAQVEAEDPEHRAAVLKQLVQDGYRRLYIEHQLVEIEEIDIESVLDRSEFPVIVDRVVVREGEHMRLSEALEKCFSLGRGRAFVFRHKSEEEPRVFDQAFRCSHCGQDATEPQPALFSFNSSLGACPTCTGFGKTVGLDFKKVIPNSNLSLRGGAIAPFETKKYARTKDGMLRMCMKQGIAIDVPFRRLTRDQQRIIKEGGHGWMGVRKFFSNLEQKQYKTHVRVLLARYRGYDDCPDCLGGKLGEDARQVLVHDKTISDLWMMRLEELLEFFESTQWGDFELAQVQVLIDEIKHRLDYLTTVGLGYLTLERQSRTLSGGEMQRIHLTASLGRALTDTLYVLDEPTAGLHAVDSQKLLNVLRDLRDLGNTVVVVEHDPEIIEGADHIIEVGPLSGEQGGELVFDGPMDEFTAQDTLTAVALRERLHLSAKGVKDDIDLKKGIKIVGAREHNLDNLEVTFPYNKMCVVTGVSGSGKSTLMHTTLYNGWRRLMGQGGVDAGVVDSLEGLDVFEDVVLMSQSAMGRSSRSNAMSYTKAYDDVRKLLSSTEDAQMLGLSIGDFSFNTPGGRCENCKGAGTITIEMHFMADVEITCPECQGKRFTDRVLGVSYRGKNIDDILSMTVHEALVFFEDHKPLVRKLKPLAKVGLGYLRLGQPTTTLSGGEAQRLKLATYIVQGSKSSRKKVKPVLFIFDEPTVGLHMRDVDVLLGALRNLIELGHTIIVIEHNTDFIARCDYVVDLGPGAGPDGGQVIACGTPVQVAEVEGSLTGASLKEIFKLS